MTTGPLLQNFSVAAGVDEDVIVTIATSIAGDTLVGATVYWRAFEQQFGQPIPNTDPVIEKNSLSGGGIDILESPPMTFRIRMLAADTADRLRNYYHETLVVGEVGDRSDPVAGLMTVTQTEIRLV